MIKPTIRLAKIWNANAGYVFESFVFEKWIAQLYFSTLNQRDCLFTVFDNLYPTSNEQWRKDKIQRAKDIIARVRQLERDDMPFSAEAEVAKLFPTT